MIRYLGGAAALMFAVVGGSAWAGPQGPHGQALGQPGSPDRVTRTIHVVMTDDMRFTPSKIDVKVGETIRFVAKNSGEAKHEMVIGTAKELKEHAVLMQKFPEMEHDDPNAVTVVPGKSGEFIWQFTRPGTFKFACLMPGHFEAGMVGNLNVRNPSRRPIAAKPRNG